MGSDVGYRGGGGALVGVAGNVGGDVGRGIAEIDGDDAIVFEDYRAFGGGDFEAAGIPGICGGGSEKRGYGAAGEFEVSDGGVFGFDFVQEGGCAGLQTHYVAEQPEEQVDGVDGLIDEGAATVEGEGAAPFGVAVVAGRAIPLDARVDEQWLAPHAGGKPLLLR